MKQKITSIFKNWRVLLLLFFIIISLVSIFSLDPSNWTQEGVAIRAVSFNSSAAEAGMENPASDLQPIEREVITEINGQKITNEEDYFQALTTLSSETTILLETDQGSYTLLPRLNAENEVDLGITVEEVPRTNLRKGLDLAGGTRVLLSPDEPVSADDLDLIVSNLQERLNVYGLSDVLISSAKDLAGNDFILIEIAGATESEVRALLASQGKFEAKIGEEVVFSGGNNDISYVCRSADCSGIDPQRGCYQTSQQGGYGCSFFFGITLTPNAAQHQAEVTEALDVVYDNGYAHLSEDLTLYLDDAEVDSLRIAADLKGRAVTEIQITGAAEGNTQEEALDNALQDMKQLQTIIATGSLPVSLSIVKMDTVSPSLGEEFLNNMFLIALFTVLAVTTIVGVRYRKLQVAGPMIFTMLAEIILILGFAALFKWQLDLAAIAGIIIVAGTGVDHLIIITDETIRGEKAQSMKARIKQAMFIVFGAYMTTVAGMIPLLWAGAGLLKGFALTTIAGISFGVLIARPAFAAMIEVLLEDDEAGAQHHKTHHHKKESEKKEVEIVMRKRE